MAEIWQPKNKAIIQDWIDTIKEELSDELSAWETSFIDSVETQLHKYGQLSQKQEEIVENIYSRTP